MNRRLVLASLLAVVVGGIATPALAGSDSEPRREKLCVKQATVFPDGYCITWNDPLAQDR